MFDPFFELPASGLLPWVIQDSYAGWVANVSGHLSFGLIDIRPSRAALNHQPDDIGQRIVAVHRRRAAQDFPVAGEIVSAFRPWARQDYLLIAKTQPTPTPFFEGDELKELEDRNGVLVGVIAVLPEDDNHATRKERAKLLARLDDRIGAAAALHGPLRQQQAEKLPEALLRELWAERGRIACHVLRFALYRTGELRIWIIPDEFAGRDVSTEPMTDVELDAARFLPSQTYFFVKDVLHHHYHHDRHSDQLLPLSLLPAPRTPAGQVDNEVRWRSATVRGLARTVVELRHAGHPGGNQNALGILAYADAFQAVLARIARGAKIEDAAHAHGRIIAYDFCNVRSSIEATDAAQESRKGANLQLFGIIVGVILSALALWSGAVQIQPILCEALAKSATPCPAITPGAMAGRINWIVANPMPFVAFLSTLGFIAFLLLFRSSAAVPMAKPISHILNRFSYALAATISRALNGRDKIAYAAQLLFLGALTTGIAYAAYEVAPRKIVPPIPEPSHAPPPTSGPWSSLDAFVGRRPADSGLLIHSVITQDLQNMLGEDYGQFLSMLDIQSPLLREQLLSFVGGRADSPARDGAYLMIDQRTQRLEAGLRRNGVLTVYRTPGTTLPKTRLVARWLGGAIWSDVGPISAEAPVCRVSRSGPGGRTIQLSGMLRPTSFCEYRLDLQDGQVVQYRPEQARGLEVVAIGQDGKERGVDQGYVVTQQGATRFQVSWQGPHLSLRERRTLRPFYVRLDVQ